jgi:hypothetical protein
MRVDDYVELMIEHRAAASQGDIQLKLQTHDQRAFLTYESSASIWQTLNDLVKNKEVCKTEDNNYSLAIEGKKPT